MAALRISEPDRTPVVSQTAEGTEYRAMLERANVGNVYDALLNHRAVSGVEAELQAHLGLAGNMIPLDLLRGAGNGGRGNGGLEHRAVTPGADNVGQVEQPVIPYVFPASAAAFLGVSMPTVGVGEVVYPVLTATLAVGTPAENAAQAETTGAFSSDVLVPSRLQASLFLFEGRPGQDVHARFRPAGKPFGRAGGRAGRRHSDQPICEPDRQRPNHRRHFRELPNQPVLETD